MSAYKCFCGTLGRLKYRGVRCIICRTECTLHQPSDMLCENEMADWLACDYKDMGLRNAIRLTVHSRGLVDMVRKSGKSPIGL